jgi:hypothetical protein
MKKVFAGLVILLSAVLCLSGCEDNKIDDGLEKQVTEKGKEMMQAWVDENMPGAELENCKAYIDYAPGPGRYLTDYASGVNGGQDVLTAVQLSLITRRWGTITLFAGRSG